MKTFFEFSSGQFNPTAEELDEGSDEYINPGLFARELSTWLSKKLEAKGWNIRNVAVEDWGHWIELETSNPKPLAVCCGQQYEGHHLIFTDPSKPTGRRGLFGKYDLAKELSKLTEQIEEFLSTDPEIKITAAEESRP